MCLPYLRSTINSLEMSHCCVKAAGLAAYMETVYGRMSGSVYGHILQNVRTKMKC